MIFLYNAHLYPSILSAYVSLMYWHCQGGRIPDDWKISLLIPNYNGKGDPLFCGSHREIKLFEHTMKELLTIESNR